MKSILRFVRLTQFHSGVNQSKYFNKVLVANRGEIACRVMKTCKKLGIKTVAVFTDADRNSKFVKMADEAYYLGPNEIPKTYNNIEAIIKAMKETGVDAVHPGYGFLSENEVFCKRVKDEGFVFIGPPHYAIEALGDKIQSKLVAKSANVNTIPGFEGEIRDVDHAVEVSNQIGYPVMVKASAGGGGKGMRVCFNEKEVRDNYPLCKGEAKNFANDRILVEKFVENPRHVEIQVMGDQHGNYVYCNERECSIQRRNQKVIEEAPSCALTPEVRKAMGEQACALARKVGYFSAGTVEMMVSKKKDRTDFYFLEMNTRLQVEHPITEMTTGLDLVELMIKVAAGEKLPITQKDIGIKGWATECRVYAEDPLNNFSPAIGQLQNYIEPSGDGIRVDSGILEKDEITVFFDPMICKLVAWGKNREQSVERMISALDKYIIYGKKVKHNVNFLRDVLQNKKYRSGNITTNFIKEEYPQGFKGIQLTNVEFNYLAGAAIVAEFIKSQRDRTTTGKTESFKIPTKQEYTATVLDKVIPCEISIKGDNKYALKFGGKTMTFETSWMCDSPILETKIDGKTHIFQVLDHTFFKLLMQYKGTRFTVDVKSKKEQELSKHMLVIPPPDLSKMIVSEMAGQIVSVNCKPGQKVEEGDDLGTMEAMKMRNILKAPKSGIIKIVNVKAGDVVENGQLLFEYDK